MKTIIQNNQDVIDTFLKFCYNFPYDLEERFSSPKYFGSNMGKHLYRKFKGFCQRKENTFVALIYCFGDMDRGNRKIFLRLIDDYNESIK